MAGPNTAEMRLAAEAIRRFAVAGATEFVQGMLRNTTSRSGVAPGIPVKTGEARGSGRVTTGAPSTERWQKRAFYPFIGANDVERAMSGFHLGESVFYSFLAAHPPVLELGRHVDSRGRMAGSLQAPSGFLHFSRDQTISEMGRWRYVGP